MESEYLKKITVAAILLLLIVLAFFLIRPIIMSIVIGIILGFIFLPMYESILKKISYPNILALLFCIVLAMLIVLPIWFLAPVALDESFKIFQSSQSLDLVSPLKKIFPSFFSSDEFSRQMASIMSSFVTKTTNGLMNAVSGVILDFPTLMLKMLVTFFVFFFVLRDKKKIIKYIKSVSPFSKAIEKNLFDSTRNITSAVLYGQVIVGLIQGLVIGAGFFIFGISSMVLLTVLACVAGIIPIIGTALVWVPIVIYLIISGSIIPAIGIIVFGLISSNVDVFLRPIIISKRSTLHSGIVLVGMIGGIFLFGVMGFILGPLIFSYLLILLEIYRKKSI